MFKFKGENSFIDKIEGGFSVEKPYNAVISTVSERDSLVQIFYRNNQYFGWVVKCLVVYVSE
jgi:hypothetical protein